MIREHDIRWFLEEPTRLTLMKPFTRGGNLTRHGYEGERLTNNMLLSTGFASLELYPISQDTYITEYRPDLHLIKLNEAIPHIKVTINNVEIPSNLMDMTQTAAFQKLIHSAHVRNLTANPLELNLCADEADDNARKLFGEIKNEWVWRGCEWNKYMAINTCKQLGNCGVLFSYDPVSNRYSITNYSYEDGYQIVPNYDEYGMEIARSLVYQVDDRLIIDTYDAVNHYRVSQVDGEWDIKMERHGFSRCPLLHKRGKVAWEYAESSIEMWELLVNIRAMSLKRFGTFGLIFTGDMDETTFRKDSSTLIINLSSDTTNGKQDARTLEYPESKTLDGTIKSLEENISLFSSTSFITPRDLTNAGTGGNGIALAMSNDYALATQSALDWQRFMCDMVYLHQEGLDLESNGTNKYSSLKIGAKINPWSLETNNTKILNLIQEGNYLSTQTLLEKLPDSAPDEVERVINERGTLTSRATTPSSDEQKAANLARNRSDEIVDNVESQE